MRLVTEENYLAYISRIGTKASRLFECLTMGLQVPPLVVIPIEVVQQILLAGESQRATLLDELQVEIIQSLGQSGYAVRSAAMIEDTSQQSMAGQFHTELAVPPDQLIRAIISVINQAQQFLQEKEIRFSVIVQKYIEPEYAGVTFTRAPTAERHMIVEYHTGSGAQLVGGEVTPLSAKWHWNESVPSTLPPPIQSAIGSFCLMEKSFGYPQDIEWCVKDDIVWILQSRPITTISKEQYMAIDLLETSLPKGDYYYGKTEVSEIVPRPVPIMFDLLKQLYAASGPIAHVYMDHQIRYHPTDFFFILGNELFIDKEKELQTILPAYSTLNQTYAPKPKRFRGLITSFRNTNRLMKLSLNTYHTLGQKLSRAFEGYRLAASLQDWIELFMHDYCLIFEINVLCGVAQSRFVNLVNREKKHQQLTDILNSAFPFSMTFDASHVFFKGLKGNSLDVADESPFIRTQLQTNHSSDTSADPLNNAARYVRTFDQLREVGRWLTVLHINNFRELLFFKAKKLRFHSTQSIYFARLDEVLTDSIDQQQLIQRERLYKSFQNITLPAEIQSRYTHREGQQKGLSAGIAMGTLVEVRDLPQCQQGADLILFTDQLTPDLARHFSVVKGIVTLQGGMLSHLAILAREAKIPIIVGFQRAEVKGFIGNWVKIDGTLGTMTKGDGRLQKDSK